MATKGNPEGVYAPEQISSDDAREIAAWAMREFSKIQRVMEIAIARNVEFLNAEPDKLREGMVRGADGTNWDPGSGQGVYAYYNSAWNKLG